MKTAASSNRKGFTLVELLVVMVIMGVLMTMAANVLQESGKGRGVDSGVQLLESLVREARTTAIGNDTPTRIIIVDDERNTRAESGHLRATSVMMFRKTDRVKGEYDGSSIERSGKWVTVSTSVMPPQVYISPYYSRALEWTDGRDTTMIGKDSMHLPGRGTTRVYYIEFDEKGRFVSPMADPLNPTRAQRIVVMSARRGQGRKAHEGIQPLQLDNKGRPIGAKGIVLWPSGDTSRLRTLDQITQ
ncbi:MAG: prepilin-type N-terminal cleavage/methylation domain-containing protein [Akkermansia sp.]